jgi:hypothetical protein
MLGVLVMPGDDVLTMPVARRIIVTMPDSLEG